VGESDRDDDDGRNRPKVMEAVVVVGNDYDSAIDVDDDSDHHTTGQDGT